MKKLVSLALAVLMLACIFGTCLAEAPAEKRKSPFLYGITALAITTKHKLLHLKKRIRSILCA